MLLLSNLAFIRRGLGGIQELMPSRWEPLPVAASGCDPSMPSLMCPEGIKACSHPPAGRGSGLAVHLPGGDWHLEGRSSQDREASRRFPLRGPGASPGGVPKGKGEAQGDITLVLKMPVLWSWTGSESQVRDTRKMGSGYKEANLDTV